jgi:hypothetical protein
VIVAVPVAKVCARPIEGDVVPIVATFVLLLLHVTWSVTSCELLSEK